MSSSFRFVEDHRGAFGVKRLCRILAVSRSGFYRWLAGASARAGRARADAELAELINRIHQESDGTYGVPRVTAELKEAGRPVNHKRVERVMRKFHIVGLHLRKKVRTTIPEPSATPVPDLLQRDFAAQEPNTKYVGDITYLPIGNGQFLYLATVLDLCSKRLTGWSIADHMRTSLVTDALRAAARARGGDGLRGAIFHSDNGAAICVEGVRPGLLGTGRDQIARRGRHKCGQRRRGESERDHEARDAPGPQAVERGQRGPPRGLPLGDPLQHPPTALPPRPDQPDHLRTAINYAGHRRMKTGVHDHGEGPETFGSLRLKRSGVAGNAPARRSVLTSHD